MIFLAFLMFAAADAPSPQTPPIKPVCRRDNAGKCLPAEPSPPAKLLRKEHDQAAAIYQPYWVCYWQALEANNNFGTSDAQLAKQIMSSAVNACGVSKAAADSKMDALLYPLAIYGDNAHKRFVRDYFRSSAGDVFLDRTARAAGQYDAYVRTREAYQRFVLGEIEKARRQ